MKHILKANQIQSNKEDYFDEEKKVYNPVPVFPFLTIEAIDIAVQEAVNPAALALEVEQLYKASKTTNSTIVNSEFIICLIERADYPELTNLLFITREWAFRNDGGGVGHIDYDDFDLRPEMRQLIIINPFYEDVKGCIIGGYRYIIHTEETYEKGPMGAHFDYSDKWKSETWIELGRSFINPYFQTASKKYSIDYVLHGLGYIFAQYPEVKGYFGKVTLYNIYEQQGADKFFLAVAKTYFSETADIWVDEAERITEGVLTEEEKKMLDEATFKGLYYLLRKNFKVNIVPIMAVYNRMTPLKNILYFGAFRHFEFGNTTEVGIAIKSSDLHEIILEKFVHPYLPTTEE